MGKSKDIFSEKYPAHIPTAPVWAGLVLFGGSSPESGTPRSGPTEAFSPDAGFVLENPGAAPDTDPKCPMSVGGPRQVIRVHAATGVWNSVIIPAENTTFPGHIFLFAAVKQVYFCAEPP